MNRVDNELKSAIGMLEGLHVILVDAKTLMDMASYERAGRRLIAIESLLDAALGTLRYAQDLDREGDYDDEV